VSVLHVRQIRSALAKLLQDKIDLGDLLKASDERKEDAFATRALGAYGVALAAGVTADAVAPYVVDGFGDNGIDVIFFEPDEKRLFIGQSKFVKSGEAGIALGDILKFNAGVSDLLKGDFSNFARNKRAQDLQSLVRQALDDASTKITLVLAHTSIEPLSLDVKARIRELTEAVNDASDLIDFREINQSELHSSLSGQADGAPINLEAMITDWGHVREPFQAYYGQINAAELATWYGQYGDRLFARNIRKALGTTEPNRQISDTARDTPEHFWYFNNGVTVLCQTVIKKPLGGAGKGSAVLDCRGASIVNGAQTAAALANAAQVALDSVKRATALVRFISLENCPSGFAAAVTRATNVQNRIEHRDFASLDPVQERLRRELLLEGKIYAYKTGDAPSSESACTLEEAAIALACSNSDMSLAVIAKGNIGRIWEGIDDPKAIYRRLFNEHVSGVRLWRLVELSRTIEETLKREHISRIDGREKMIAVHGNRFVAHQIFQRVELRTTSEVNCDLEGLRQQAKKLVPTLIGAVGDAVAEVFPTAYPQSLFKNVSKCAAVSEALRRPKGLRPTPPASPTVVLRQNVAATPKGKQSFRAKGAGKEASPVELNDKEMTVLRTLQVDPNGIHLTILGPKAFPELDEARSNSWARNSVRKPLQKGFISRLGKGIYKLTEEGVAFLGEKARG
jgi:hypothetical protein